MVVLFALDPPTRIDAVIEADKLGQLRTGAASGVAAKYLARPGASTLGVIGCGWQAESQVAAIRAAVPTIERTVAYCRTPERLRSHADVADFYLGGVGTRRSYRDVKQYRRTRRWYG